MEDLTQHKPTTIRLRQGRHGDSFYAEVQSLKLTGDLDAIVPLVMNEEANFRAMSLANKLKDGPGAHFGAVYLIAPEDDDFEVVKVGIADNPLSRLCGLQIGNWNKLAVKGLIWFDNGPGEVERLVHQAAKEMEISLRGEWISASPKEAALLALKAARFAKRTCYDSNIWIKNWSSRVDALAVKKRLRVG